MRKWFLIGAVAVALGGIAGSWCYDWQQRITTGVTVLPRVQRTTPRAAPFAKNDGNAEICETIEPLVVERGSSIASARPPLDEEALRVVLTPGMTQPPRPDAGCVLRMPYADEEELLALPRYPLTLILEAGLSKLNIFEELLKNTDPAEESENKEPMPTAERPEPMPMPNYHHHDQYCPYSGGHCPAPYNYYPRR